MIIMNNDPAPAAADEFQTDEPGTGNGFRTQACSDAGQGRIIRRTSSLCPVCLKKIPAVLERKEMSQAPGRKQISTSRTMVFMKKTCPDHGTFQVPVWKDRISLEDWISREDPLTDTETERCSGDCRTCLDTGSTKEKAAKGQVSMHGLHGQDTCCVILEVTKCCNLRCSYCFANGGEENLQPSYRELCASIDDIALKGGGPLIQLSGGEPTLRDDLPNLVRYAREAGCQYTQINTNGIRLAQDEAYVKRLAEAGLDIVFLQYDGADDEIYRKLRGRDLAQIKLKAIQNCGKYRIGVTLVPTIVRGVNDHALGQIIREAARLFPAVRSVHFQPVTYLGRHPDTLSHGEIHGEIHGDMLSAEDGKNDVLLPKDDILLPYDHYTLDELIADLCTQTGIPESALLPSRCDHAMCEFHSTFLVNSRRQLVPMTDRAHDVRRTRTPAARNRQYVAEHWRRERSVTDGTWFAEDITELDINPASVYGADFTLVSGEKEELDFDVFVHRMRTQTLKISAMAFQDAMNIDFERLYRCSLHVYEEGRLIPFCAKYMTQWC